MTEHPFRIPSRENHPQPAELQDGLHANLKAAGRELGSYNEGTARADVDAIMTQRSTLRLVETYEKNDFEGEVTTAEIAHIRLARLINSRNESMLGAPTEWASEQKWAA